MKRGIIGLIIAVMVMAGMSRTVYAETSVSVEDLLSYIQGEAGADGEITLYEMFQLYAEMDHAGNEVTGVVEDEEATGVVEDASEPKGYSSEIELLQAYTDCLNGDLNFDKFFESFDKTGYLAYWIQEERGMVTVPEAYEVLLEMDKGVSYIRTAYPEFVQKWEDHTGSPLTDESLAEFVTEFAVEDDLAYREFSAFMQELSNQFGPFDPTVQTDEIWHSDYGYCDYGISVEDPTDYIQSIGIIYMERNGKYYWVMLHQTA